MFGIDDVTTPIFIITCIPINVVIPVANRLPNISGDFIAIKIPLQINIANSKITITQPIKPNSSANIENIKSLCGSGIYKYFCLLSPNPTPKSPPEPIAYNPWTACHPTSVASAQGSIKDIILFYTESSFSRGLQCYYSYCYCKCTY